MLLPPTTTKEELLAYIAAFDVVNYSKTRNHIRGGVSYLSPFISRGVISLSEIRDIVLARFSATEAEKFIQELAWREYFQKVYEAKENTIFSELRFSRDDWRHYDLVTTIETANTGIVTVDAAISDLYATGYMHNHVRLWTAMIACNIAKAHWLTMSRWLYYHLFDGDLASNTLSWQWVAGTSVQKRYLANQSIINSCSSVKQPYTYLNGAPEVLSNVPVPEVLEATTKFTLKMEYPVADMVPDVSGKIVHLYHPWSIDPGWRSGEEAVRIFIIEPALFDRFPVSPKVCAHMLELLKTHIPSALVYVGLVEDIAGIKSATVFSKKHPATTHFPGTKDPIAELFPAVTGYFPSFFTFWQACLKAK